MSQAMNYAQVANKQKKVVCEEKDVLILTYEDGKVNYKISKSAEFLEREHAELEKKLANSLQVRMNRAIEEIEARRCERRKKDMDEYGYDHYTKEFYYECPETPENSDDEEE